MKKKTVSFAIGRMDVEPRPGFNVVLAYDEFASGVRAKKFFDDLTRIHGELFKFNCQLWKFEAMREPELFEAAARDAASAEMIVIATQQSEAVSDDARRWIERWLLPKDAHTDAIVVLLSGKAAGAGSGRGMRAGLRRMVEGSGVAFLSKEIDWPAMESQFAVKITEGRRREEFRRPAPAFSADAGQPRWGLNE